MDKDELVRVNLVITTDMHEWLNKMAELNNLSRSQIVRIALVLLQSQPETPLVLKYNRKEDSQ